MDKEDLDNIVAAVGHATSSQFDAISERRNESQQRLAKLETEQYNIEKSITTLAEDTKRNFDAVFKKMSEMNKTPWAAIGVMFSLMFFILAALGSGYVRDQDRNERAIEILLHEFSEHRLTDGHPAMVQRVSALEEQLAREIQYRINSDKMLDEVLQREMEDKFGYITRDNKQEILVLRGRVDEIFKILHTKGVSYE